MLDAGMHYGHHASRWNPKMGPYIYGKRNTIHIIDLRQTMRGLITACRFINHTVSTGKTVVFVGTKRQARRAVRDESVRCGMPYVVERWLGGTLTNFRTIRSRLDRLLELEEICDGPAIADYSKKDGSRMRRELSKIKRNLDGIRNMDKVPAVVVVVDPRREKNAIAEAARLNLPTIGLADTDCDPDKVDVIIPGNDDAMRSVSLVMRCMADAVIEGKGVLIERQRVEAEATAAKAAEEAKKKAETRAVADKLKADADAVARGAEQHRTQKSATAEEKPAAASAPAAGPKPDAAPAEGPKAESKS